MPSLGNGTPDDSTGNCHRLLSIYHEKVLDALHGLFHLTFTTTQRVKCFYHHHFEKLCTIRV